MSSQKNRIRIHYPESILLFRISESLLIFLTLIFFSWQRSETLPRHPFYLALAAVSIFLYFLIGDHQGLYRHKIGERLSDELKTLWKVWAWIVFMLLVSGFALKITHRFSRLVIMSWFLAVPLVLSAWRSFIFWQLKRWRCKGYNVRTAVILGTGKWAEKFSCILQSRPGTGIRFSGFFAESGAGADSPECMRGRSMPVLGSFKDAVEQAKKGEIDLVFLAPSVGSEWRMKELIVDFADTTASVYVLIPESYGSILYSEIKTFDEFTAISVYESPFGTLNRFLKRMEDIMLSCLILAIVFLPMIVISIIVKATSKGPVLFKQRRYGLSGQTIEVWKFRTMTVCEDDRHLKQASRQDPRVTPVGFFLRRTSLDELPQFFNVLKGEMSIVGPRPHAVYHNEQYRRLIPGYMLRHKVKPGITGWAQVNGWRGETDTLDKMEKRVEYDLEYIRNWSLFFDIRIIFLTLVKGVWFRNAY